MSVLKGEGKVPILFGTASMPVRSRTHRGYISRPDLGGEWPTIVVAGRGLEVSSSVKDLCRRLARQGFAAVAPASPTSDGADAAAAIAGAIEFITNPAGFWSSAERGFGFLGIQSGTLYVAALASDPRLLGVALVSPEPGAAGSVTAAVLGLLPRDHDVDGVRSSLPAAELVVYDGVQSDFLDDSAESFDQSAFTDALARISDFFDKRLEPTR